MTVTQGTAPDTPDTLAAAERPGPAPEAGSRLAGRKTRRAFRPRRVVPAVLAALLLTVAGTLLAAETVSVQLTGVADLVPVRTLTNLGMSRHFADPAALAVAAVVAAAGLVLVILALTPGRSTVVPLTSDQSATLVGITRPSLRRYLADAATTVDGISRASARLTRRSVRVRACSPLRDCRGLQPQVGEAVRDCLTGLSPVRPLTVHVIIRHRED